MNYILDTQQIDEIFSFISFASSFEWKRSQDMRK
jgi:hypothetical protein